MRGENRLAPNTVAAEGQIWRENKLFEGKRRPRLVRIVKVDGHQVRLETIDDEGRRAARSRDRSARLSSLFATYVPVPKEGGGA